VMFEMPQYYMEKLADCLDSSKNRSERLK
jgi:hypothetical protein